MKSNLERSNECLPPKKREIPPSTHGPQSRSLVAPPAAKPPENATWPAASSTAQSDAPRYQSPPSTSSSTRLSAVCTSPLPQTGGGTLHYTQLPANLQFITSPYNAAYASYVAPQLLPPPSSYCQRLLSLPEMQERASVRYAAAMPPPPTLYADVAGAGKEDSRELHNGGLERSRGVKLHDAYEARRAVPLPDSIHEPSRTSVVLEDRQLSLSRGDPGKPLKLTPVSSNHTFPPPSCGDNLKACVSPLSPQTLVQTARDSPAEPPCVGLTPGGIYPQSPVIGYIAGAGSSQHAAVSYHGSLQQHVLLPGARPVIIPLDGSALSSARASGGDHPAGSYHRGSSSGPVRAQLHFPTVPSAVAAPPSLPAYFVKGSIIQLADGELKRVEELKTEDFIQSAEISSELKIDSSTVERIDGSHASPNFAIVHFSVGERRSQVSVEVLAEYPFFVFGQGWSSCCPDRTSRLLELPCTKLAVGDVCISLTLKNLSNGSLSKTQPPEPVAPRSAHGFLLEAPKALSRVSVHRERENGAIAVQNGDMDLVVMPSKLSGTSGRKRRWSAPEARKVEKAEDLPSAKLTFIPHEVKVTIEGRSNLGK
ncbi:ataxin-1 [Syngnathus scovelli]|uniref:ataxin-1 n=1 Tax=Syngnathus scovelli TaxID=161590 RepID=UPI00211002C3|nr:ataxin-1 [Syngnathus scovelli]XP_049607755.1 ataxin-1 [Syngnathus scovelli]